MPIIADLPEEGEIWYAGDTQTIQITLEEEGEPVPLTGWTATFTAKLDKTDADNALTTIQKTSPSGGIEFIDAANGVMLITLDAADTKDLEKDTTYYWDVELSQSGEVFTVAAGTMKFVQDITQV
jgi:hypothetical protein